MSWRGRWLPLRSDATIEARPLQLWGGAECTVNRVGDTFHDQTTRTRHPGHAPLASLGFAALRIPVLWERVAPDGLAGADWAWADTELAWCRTQGIQPIVGLLHHGSGPRHTHLLDPAFPEAFAEYAGVVAARYPWVTQWTPVNEPLTTARFSALYGHWYPHRRDNDAYLTALLHQLRASVLAMQAIRRHVPRAQFVFTEDLGRASGSPELAYQCDWENERRWLSIDLLRGASTAGVRAARNSTAQVALHAQFDWLAAHPCTPDVFGINHYITSNRHLDQRVHLFADVPVGGNGRDRYVDVESVRVRGVPSPDVGELLGEAWQRTGLPLALTEVHLQGSADEQRRWLHLAWTSAQAARTRGIDVRAVTAWGLFGHVDWHNLVTRADGRYEPGAFDTRTQPCTPGALVPMLRSLARTGSYAHPCLDTPGWWRGDDRYGFSIEPLTPSPLRDVRLDTLVPALPAAA